MSGRKLMAASAAAPATLKAATGTTANDANSLTRLTAPSHQPNSGHNQHKQRSYVAAMQPHNRSILLQLLAAAALSLILIFALAAEHGHAASLNPVGKFRSASPARERGCYYMLQHFKNGETIKTDEPCLNCTCENSMLMCYLRVCPYVKPVGDRCIIERVPGECCPRITCPEVGSGGGSGVEQEIEPAPTDSPVASTQSTPTSTSTTALSTSLSNSDATTSSALVVPADVALTNASEVSSGARGCKVGESYYHEGAQLPGDANEPCLMCYCIGGMSMCVTQDCALGVSGCAPIYAPGTCCPVKYNCSAQTATGSFTTHRPPLLQGASNAQTTQGASQASSGRRRFWETFTSNSNSPDSSSSSSSSGWTMFGSPTTSSTTSTTQKPLFLPDFGRGSTKLAAQSLAGASCRAANSTRRYADGERVPSKGKCEHCYCMRGEIVCAVQECRPPCDGCVPIIEPTDKDCCPKRYECAAPTQRVSADNVLVEADNESAAPSSTASPVTSDAQASTDSVTATPQAANPDEQAADSKKSTAAAVETSVMTTRQTKPPLKPIAPKLSSDDEQPNNEVPQGESAVAASTATQSAKSGKSAVGDLSETAASTASLSSSTQSPLAASSVSSITVDGFNLAGEREQEAETVGKSASGRFVAQEGSAIAPGASSLPNASPESNEVLPSSTGSTTESAQLTSTPATMRAASTSAATVTTQLPTTTTALFDQSDLARTPAEQTGSERRSQRPPVVPSSIPGEGSCRYNGLIYQNGQEVKPKDNCMEICMCINSVVYCDEIDCPKGPENQDKCQRIVTEGECCPKYICPEETTTTTAATTTTSSTVATPTTTLSTTQAPVIADASTTAIGSTTASDSSTTASSEYSTTVSISTESSVQSSTSEATPAASITEASTNSDKALNEFAKAESSSAVPTTTTTPQVSTSEQPVNSSMSDVSNTIVSDPGAASNESKPEVIKLSGLETTVATATTGPTASSTTESGSDGTSSAASTTESSTEKAIDELSGLSTAAPAATTTTQTSQTNKETISPSEITTQAIPSSPPSTETLSTTWNSVESTSMRPVKVADVADVVVENNPIAPSANKIESVGVTETPASVPSLAPTAENTNLTDTFINGANPSESNTTNSYESASSTVTTDPNGGISAAKDVTPSAQSESSSGATQSVPEEAPMTTAAPAIKSSDLPPIEASSRLDPKDAEPSVPSISSSTSTNEVQSSTSSPISETFSSSTSDPNTGSMQTSSTLIEIQSSPASTVASEISPTPTTTSTSTLIPSTESAGTGAQDQTSSTVAIALVESESSSPALSSNEQMLPVAKSEDNPNRSSDAGLSDDSTTTTTTTPTTTLATSSVDTSSTDVKSELTSSTTTTSGPTSVEVSSTTDSVNSSTEGSVSSQAPPAVPSEQPASSSSESANNQSSEPLAASSMSTASNTSAMTEATNSASEQSAQPVATGKSVNDRPEEASTMMTPIAPLPEVTDVKQPISDMSALNLAKDSVSADEFIPSTGSSANNASTISSAQNSSNQDANTDLSTPGKLTSVAPIGAGSEDAVTQPTLVDVVTGNISDSLNITKPSAVPFVPSEPIMSTMTDAKVASSIVPSTESVPTTNVTAATVVNTSSAFGAQANSDPSTSNSSELMQTANLQVSQASSSTSIPSTSSLDLSNASSSATTGVEESSSTIAPDTVKVTDGPEETTFASSSTTPIEESKSMASSSPIGTSLGESTSMATSSSVVGSTDAIQTSTIVTSAQSTNPAVESTGPTLDNTNVFAESKNEIPESAISKIEVGNVESATSSSQPPADMSSTISSSNDSNADVASSTTQQPNAIVSSTTLASLIEPIVTTLGSSTNENLLISNNQTATQPATIDVSNTQTSNSTDSIERKSEMVTSISPIAIEASTKLAEEASPTSTTTESPMPTSASSEPPTTNTQHSDLSTASESVTPKIEEAQTSTSRSSTAQAEVVNSSEPPTTIGEPKNPETSTTRAEVVSSGSSEPTTTTPTPSTAPQASSSTTEAKPSSSTLETVGSTSAPLVSGISGNEYGVINPITIEADASAVSKSDLPDAPKTTTTLAPSTSTIELTTVSSDTTTSGSVTPASATETTVKARESGVFMPELHEAANNLVHEPKTLGVTTESSGASSTEAQNDLQTSTATGSIGSRLVAVTSTVVDASSTTTLAPLADDLMTSTKSTTAFDEARSSTGQMAKSESNSTVAQSSTDLVSHANADANGQSGPMVQESQATGTSKQPTSNIDVQSDKSRDNATAIGDSVSRTEGRSEMAGDMDRTSPASSAIESSSISSSEPVVGTTSASASTTTSVQDDATRETKPSTQAISSASSEISSPTIAAISELSTTTAPITTVSTTTMISTTSALSSDTKAPLIASSLSSAETLSSSSTSRPLGSETSDLISATYSSHGQTSSPTTTPAEVSSTQLSEHVDKVSELESGLNRNTTVLPDLSTLATSAPSGLTSSPADAFIASVSSLGTNFAPVNVTTVIPSIRGSAASITIPWSDISGSSASALDVSTTTTNSPGANSQTSASDLTSISTSASTSTTTTSSPPTAATQEPSTSPASLAVWSTAPTTSATSEETSTTESAAPKGDSSTSEPPAFTPNATVAGAGEPTTSSLEASDYEEISEDAGCEYEGKTYSSAQQVPRSHPCDFCFCFRGDIICLQQTCPPPVPHCFETVLDGFCCPRYECPVHTLRSGTSTGTGTNGTTTQHSSSVGGSPQNLSLTPYESHAKLHPHGHDLSELSSSGARSQSTSKSSNVRGCFVDSKLYAVGQVISSASGPCLECRCDMSGMMKCNPKECTPEDPLLDQINREVLQSTLSRTVA